MSKELEALELLKKNGFIDERTMNKLLLIEKALTPPTADEVCKALGYHLNEFPEKEKVYYRETTKIFYTFWDSELITIAKLEINNDVLIFKQLPPHLITLIGRFYEGLEELK